MRFYLMMKKGGNMTGVKKCLRIKEEDNEGILMVFRSILVVGNREAATNNFTLTFSIGTLGAIIFRIYYLNEFESELNFWPTI
mmetsp:Transcript_482/g.609  ORF Transcript_482/g.609 Transcript_482/m.609 type:complete len:83 (+) Transcript_482:1035-1283(+)